MLDVQIPILSLDTGNFYSNKESYLHLLNHKLRVERNQLINGYNDKNKKNKSRHIVGLKEIEKELNLFGVCNDELKNINDKKYNDLCLKYDCEEIKVLLSKYYRISKIINKKNKKIKETKNKLLNLLSNKVNENIKSNGHHHIRYLKENEVSSKNEILVFESSFSRMIGAKENELCEDFMVIQVYYFDIIKDLIYNGFMYNGEKYIYFTSSAGQIRTKKTVFVKELVWNKYEKTIMCGLTIDKINDKGGINTNKYLAYMALNNSATDEWKEFDIDKCIVIDDFETNVYGEYDFIDEKEYSITRTNGYVSITHTDGCGIILPNAFGQKQVNKMIRMPWIKGLLGVFDFKSFILENENNYEHPASRIIVDIYGIEHDVIDEDIQIIFTKSQFKLNKFYSSFDEYKDCYKKYNCSAGFTKPEEDRIKNSTINYQMLQSLVDVKEEEIDCIVKNSVDKLNNMCSSIDNIKDIFGVTPYNMNKTFLQKSIRIYPELLNDKYIKLKLKDIKDSMIKSYKSGKLQTNGKYTFVLPDLYAACEHWFMGIDNPKGLLKDKEIFCWLFRKNKKVDCLRSPHLFIEHAIRNNVACYENEFRTNEVRKWFCTNAIYTSCFDLISKILQFDVDGDILLVLSDEKIIEVAERTIEKYDIVPLYYNMKKAKPEILNSENIYNGLVSAFTGSNIGQYSNNISKIWNHDVFINGTDEEKKDALNVIKLLCCENNFKIDYAKTLYMPKRPKFITEKIAYYTSDKVPHFFIYAKNKKDEQVNCINESFVNRLENKIPNPRISCKYIDEKNKSHKLDKPDYRLMMYDSDIDVNIIKNNNGKLLNGTNKVVLKYIEMAKKYKQKINATSSFINDYPRDILRKTQIKKNVLYKKIVNEVKYELSQFGYSEQEVSDILVKYLYGIKQSEYKDLLWTCYGEYIYDNLSRNIKVKYKEIQCVDCGKWFEVSVFDSVKCRCKECQKIRDNKLNRISSKERMKRYRERKKKNVTVTLSTKNIT